MRKRTLPEFCRTNLIYCWLLELLLRVLALLSLLLPELELLPLVPLAELPELLFCRPLLLRLTLFVSKPLLLLPELPGAGEPELELPKVPLCC